MTAITADGCSPLVFIARGFKLNTEYQRKNMLQSALKPWARKHFGHRPWTLAATFGQRVKVSLTA